MRIAFGFAFALALLAAACGGDKKSPESGVPAARTAAPEGDPSSLATPPAGWTEFTVDDHSIWLPPSYVGGDIEDDREAVLDRIRSANPICGGGLEALADSSPNHRLITVDVDTCNVGAFRTTIGLDKQEVPSGTTPREYLEEVARTVPRGYEIVEQSVALVGGREAARVVTRVNAGTDAEARLLIIALPAGESYWLLVCTTSPDEFDERLPDFERSALTFEASLPD